MYQKPELTEQESTALLGCIHLVLQRIMQTEDESFLQLFKRQLPLMDGMQTAQKKLLVALETEPIQNMSVTVNPDTGDTQTAVYDKTSTPAQCHKRFD